MKKNKILTLVLSCFLTINLFTPTYTQAYEKKTTTITANPLSVQACGWKTKISKTALKVLSKGLRASKKAVKGLADELGGKAGRWVSAHSDDLADVLDDVISVGDFAETEVRRGIANGLRAVGAPSSVADTIANVIVWVFL